MMGKDQTGSSPDDHQKGIGSSRISALTLKFLV